ncbi:MAG: RluA family pseudouridine synthase [Candidatus Sumerlaeaceae bacterium]
MDTPVTEHILEPQQHEVSTRLDVFVSARLPQLSRTRVQKLIEAGYIRVGGTLQSSRFQIKPGDQVSVHIPAATPAVPQGETIPLDVIFEDEHLLVVNKPAGLVVHPGAGAREGTLVNALLGRPGAVSSIGGVERPGIVHRLDKDTSGLMVIAKTDACHLALSRAIAAREVKRIYLTIALRSFKTKSGRIDAPVGRHPTQRTRMAVHSHKGSRPAVTHWRVVEPFHGMALVECRLETGRTHQIRVHLAHESHPVLGDDTYGGTVGLALQLANPRSAALRTELKSVARQMLHARQLQFQHPITSKVLAFEAELPPDFARILEALRHDASGA